MKTVLLPVARDMSQASPEDAELARVLDEYLAAVEAGKPVDAEALVAAHPGIAERLRACLASLQLVEQAAVRLSAVGTPADPSGPEMGQLGDFLLVREIGRGGMGVVYEAEQISLRRRVALKVLPFAATMDARQLQRFKNEAQAATQLHHTNIVPVYYVGCERGVHFYAMQYIEGHSLAEVIAVLKKTHHKGTKDTEETQAYVPSSLCPPYLCVESSSAPSTAVALTTDYSTKPREYFRTVAQLGIQAAEALDYAHQHGIVHRDIKPANLLVEANSPLAPAGERGRGEGARLWVTDFGLAQVQSDTRLTITGDLVGTLRYMSPEQALAKRVIVDHRTDVYSLGVTLYELLILELAYSGNDRQELLRQIAFEEPRAPRRVNKRIPVELETIVLKAMEKNPADRYATAQEMADDLRRFVMDEPIRAKRPDIVQRLRKWGRRHQAAVAAVLAFLFLAVIVLAGSTVWVWTASQAERTAKETAQRRLEQIEKAINILGSIFQHLDPNAQEQGAPDLSVQLGERVDESAKLLEGGVVDDPLIVARLQNVLGSSLHELGQYEKARPLLERSLQTRETALGPEHSDTLVSKNDLARLYQAIGKYDRAESLFLEAMQGWTAKLGADHPETLGIKNNLATLYDEQQKYDRAESLLHEVLKGNAAQLGSDHPVTLTNKNNLAVLYLKQGKYDRPEPLLHEVLQVRMSKLGADHPGSLQSKNHLAGLYLSQGKYEQAEALFQGLLQANTAKLGADHPQTLSNKNNLAILYKRQGMHDRAEALLFEVLQANKAKLGIDHANTLLCMQNLAGTLREQGKNVQAERLYGELIPALTAKYGPDHEDTLITKEGLATVYWSMGKLALSVPLFEETLHGLESRLGGDHPETLCTAFNLAVNYRDAGRLDEAIALFDGKLVRARTLLAPSHPVRKFGLESGAETYTRSGRHHKAEELLCELVSVVKQQAGIESHEYAVLLVQLGVNLLQQNKPTEAEKLLRECLAIREKKEPDAIRTFNAKSVLGATLLGQKRYAEAESLLVQGYEGMRQREPPEAPPEFKVRLGEAVERLVQLYDAWGKKDKAEEWRKKIPPELVPPPKEVPAK